MGRRAIPLQRGDTFGRLTVLERRPSGEHGHVQWLCACECGREVMVMGSQLSSGRTKSCGCLRDEGRKPWAKSLVGNSYGRLTVIEMAPLKQRQAMCICQCECGTVVEIAAGSLRSGATRSCGCLNREVASERTKTHGMSHTPEYYAWGGMQSRCYNPNTESYPEYGGRGIKVAPQWLGSAGFQTFLQDMGLRPSDDHSIDRIDPDGDYAPENCRWATRIEQARNKRNNLRMTMNGETKTIVEWAEITGISYRTLRERRRRMTDQEALTTPLAPRRSRKKRAC